MKAQAIVITEIKLTISLEEAAWLEGYLQNAHSEHECQEDTEMRELFFTAIHNEMK